MIKQVKIFKNNSLSDLEEEVNAFAKEHIVVTANISVAVVGYHSKYVAMVVYECVGDYI